MNIKLLLILMLLVGNSLATGTDEVDDDYAIHPEATRFRENRLLETVSKHPCLWVTGYVKCQDRYGEHDGRHVVVQLVDADRGILDEGYSSKNGYFRVFGCSPNSFRNANPHLIILHSCHYVDDRQIKIPLPHSVHNEYNVTDMINLDAYYSHDDTYRDTIGFPCDPFE